MLAQILNALGIVNVVYAEGETTAMGDFLGNATSLLTWALSSIASVATTVMQTPVLAIGFVILLVSFAVGLFIRVAGSR